MKANRLGHPLAKTTWDQISTPVSHARRMTGLIKDSDNVLGNRLSHQEPLSREAAVQLARQEQISGVGLVHRRNTEPLIAFPDDNASNHWGKLPSSLSQRISKHIEPDS